MMICIVCTLSNDQIQTLPFICNSKMLCKTSIHICTRLLNSTQIDLEIWDFFSMNMFVPLLIFTVSSYNWLSVILENVDTIYLYA